MWSCPSPCRREIFEVGSERVARERRGYRIVAPGVVDDVPRAIDDIHVVAQPPAQIVVAGAAVKRVVAAVAGDRVGERIARPLISAVPVRIRFSTLAPRV